MAHILRLITFDVTGTLMILRPPVAYKYAEAAKKFGITVNIEEIVSSFKNEWKTLSLLHPNFGRDTGLGWEKWWTQIVTNTFRSAEPTCDKRKLEELAAFLIEEYKTPRCWALADGALDLLNYLRKSNIPLGVISNYDDRLKTTLSSLSIQSYFSFILASYSVGIMKPDKRIFELARNEIQGSIHPENCLHVGNSIEYDYLGARHAGWKSLYVGDLNEDVLNKALSSEVFKNLNELKYYLEHNLPTKDT